MIDSLLPFQVPRRSGIAVWALAGAAVNIAKKPIQASFDITELLRVFILLAIQSPYRDQRGDGRDQEESGEEPSLNIPLQEASEIIKHVGRKRKCKPVNVRLAFSCCQDSLHRNESFQDDRDDEHRAT